MFLHLGTIVQTRFGIADERGNIVKEFQAFEIKANDSSEEVFVKMARAVEDYRQKLLNETYPQAEPAPTNNSYPNRLPPPNLKR